MRKTLILLLISCLSSSILDAQDQKPYKFTGTIYPGFPVTIDSNQPYWFWSAKLLMDSMINHLRDKGWRIGLTGEFAYSSDGEDELDDLNSKLFKKLRSGKITTYNFYIAHQWFFERMLYNEVRDHLKSHPESLEKALADMKDLGFKEYTNEEIVNKCNE